MVGRAGLAGERIAHIAEGMHRQLDFGVLLYLVAQAAKQGIESARVVGVTARRKGASEGDTVNGLSRLDQQQLQHNGLGASQWNIFSIGCAQPQ